MAEKVRNICVYQEKVVNLQRNLTYHTNHFNYMNILYIIGNGFDIAQGLKTSYKDFEKWYKTQPTTNPILMQFKSDMNPDLEFWSDLEVALGKYVSKLNSIADFDTIYDDLTSSIEVYMNSQNAFFKVTNESINRYRKEAAFPDDYLEPADAEPIIRYIFGSSKARNVDITISAINLNYTSTFDKAIGFGNRGANLYPRRSCEMGEICHVHGALNDLPISLGVDSIEQIAHYEFRQEKLIVNALVKPVHNEVIRKNRAVHAMRLIDSAEMFVIFGSSIGDTDRTWWRAIYNRMMDGKSIPLIICNYTGEQRNVRKLYQWLPEEIEKTKQKFYHAIVDDKLEINKVRNYLDNRIMVALDKSMFQRKKKENLVPEDKN